MTRKLLKTFADGVFFRAELVRCESECCLCIADVTFSPGGKALSLELLKWVDRWFPCDSFGSTLGLRVSICTLSEST